MGKKGQPVKRNTRLKSAKPKSRLQKEKKPDPSPKDQTAAVAVPNGDVPNDVVDEYEKTVNTLGMQIDSFLKTPPGHQKSLPDVQLLKSIVGIAKKTTVPGLMSKLRMVPKVLLIAARRGVDTGESLRESGPSALVQALLQLSKGLATCEVQDAPSRPKQRSIFLRGNQSDEATKHLEVSKRTGKWAVRLLLECVQDNGHQPPLQFSSTSRLPPQTPTDEGNHSKLFVAPGDALDTVKSKLLSSQIANSINSLRNCDIPANEVAELCRRTCLRLCNHTASECFSSVIEAVICLAADINFSIDNRTQDLGSTLPPAFVEQLMNKANTVFPKLSLTSRCYVLRLSSAAWDSERRRASESFSSNPWLSAREEVHLVEVQATVAVTEVMRHWEFMDEVRKELSSDFQPFSNKLWKERRYYRAVLSKVVNGILEANKNTLQPIGVVPLFRRFPVKFSSMINTLSCVADGVGAMVENETALKIGAVGLKAINDCIGLEESPSLSPNAHACLICVEGILESLVWSTGYTLARSDLSASTESQETIQRLAVLIAALDTIRLPGGQRAESDEEIRMRSKEVANFLSQVVQSNSLMAQRSPRRMRCCGLLAMFLAGVFCQQSLRGIRKFVTSLDYCESIDFLRALEISGERNVGSESQRRILESYRQVVEFLQGKLEKERDEVALEAVRRRFAKYVISNGIRAT